MNSFVGLAVFGLFVATITMALQPSAGNGSPATVEVNSELIRRFFEDGEWHIHGGTIPKTGGFSFFVEAMRRNRESEAGD